MTKQRLGDWMSESPETRQCLFARWRQSLCLEDLHDRERPLSGGSGAWVLLVDYKQRRAPLRLGVLKVTLRQDDFSRELDGFKQAKDSWFSDLVPDPPLSCTVDAHHCILAPLAFRPATIGENPSLHDAIRNNKQQAHPVLTKIGYRYGEKLASAFSCPTPSCLNRQTPYEAVRSILAPWASLIQSAGQFRRYPPSIEKPLLSDPRNAISNKRAWSVEQIRMPVDLQHGDLNTKNVLWHKDDSADTDLRFIDFEKTRVASILLDPCWLSIWLIGSWLESRGAKQPDSDWRALPGQIVANIMSGHKDSLPITEFTAVLALLRSLFVPFWSSVSCAADSAIVEHLLLLTLGATSLAKASYEAREIDRGPDRNKLHQKLGTLCLNIASLAFERCEWWRGSAALRTGRTRTAAMTRVSLRSHELIGPALASQQTPNPRAFYKGAPPSWADLGAHLDIRRTIIFEDRPISLETFENDVLGPAIGRARDSLDVPLIAILGHAGSGKTTLLRRLGYDAGHRITPRVCVLSHLTKAPLDVADYELAHEQYKADVLCVLVDDAEGKQRSLHDIRDRLRDGTVPICFICAAQVGPWRTADTISLRLNRLDDREIEELIDKLATHALLGILTGRPRSEQRQIIKDNLDRQLLVALREATEGDDFDRIILKEYGAIPDRARPVYFAACLLQAANTQLSQEAAWALGTVKTMIEARDHILGPCEDVIIPVAGTRGARWYVSRHQIIAEVIARHAITDHAEFLEHLIYLLESLAPPYWAEPTLGQLATVNRLLRSEPVRRNLAVTENRSQLVSALRLIGAQRPRLVHMLLSRWYGQQEATIGWRNLVGLCVDLYRDMPAETRHSRGRWLLPLAGALKRLADLELAEEIARVCLAAQGDEDALDESTFDLLAQLMWEQGRLGDAADLCIEGIRRLVVSGEEVVRLNRRLADFAKHLARGNEVASALDACARGIRVLTGPRHPQIALWLAMTRISEQSDGVQKAIEICGRGIESVGDCRSAWILYGERGRLRAGLAGALEDYRESLGRLKRDEEKSVGAAVLVRGSDTAGRPSRTRGRLGFIVDPHELFRRCAELVAATEQHLAAAAVCLEGIAHENRHEVKRADLYVQASKYLFKAGDAKGAWDVLQTARTELASHWSSLGSAIMVQEVRVARHGDADKLCEYCRRFRTELPKKALVELGQALTIDIDGTVLGSYQVVALAHELLDEGQGIGVLDGALRSSRRPAALPNGAAMGRILAEVKGLSKVSVKSLVIRWLTQFDASATLETEFAGLLSTCPAEFVESVHRAIAAFRCRATRMSE